jgi:CDP-diacylglycerol--glycerol-3-phosphate 3-phosphatidyltransferase
MSRIKIKHIPNLLSGYRLFTFPLLVYLIYTKQLNLFAIFFFINLTTDVLDGFIARRFNAGTDIGARLDSVADMGSFIAAMYAAYAFFWSDILPYKQWFYVFLGLYILSNLISLIKFRTYPSLHLYSMKINGLINSLFLLVLFTYKFSAVFFIVAVASAILACIEEIICLLYIKEMQSNVKSIFTLLKKND